MSETTNHCVARGSRNRCGRPWLRGQHVDAGLAVGQRLVDREAGGHFLVEFAGDLKFALPDRRSELVGDVADVVAVELAQELVAGEKLGQRTVADAEELHIGDVHVDGDDGNAAPRGGRQHEAVAGEAGRRRTVLDIDRQHDRAFQHLADRGRQAGTEGDAIMTGRAPAPRRRSGGLRPRCSWRAASSTVTKGA